MTRWLLVFVTIGACGQGAPPPVPSFVPGPPPAPVVGIPPVPGAAPMPGTPSVPEVPGTPPVPGVAAVPGPSPVAAAPQIVAPAVAPAVPPAAPATPGTWAVPPWLCTEDVTTIVRNRGGSSITFRMRVASGGKLAFKPDQLAGFSRYRAELAAYRLSEALGWGHVPPSCERSFSSGPLTNAAGGDAEFVARLGRELRHGPDGRVRGAAILWVEGLRPLDIFPGQIAGHALQVQLSDMILFDELCGNWDRWSGGNTFTDATGLTMVLIDNAAGFAPMGDERRARMDRVLDLAVTPSAGFVAALTRLARTDVVAALAGIYGDDVVDAVIARRDRMLARRASRAAGAR